MRISDWSSDVCSSDLIRQRGLPRHQRIGLEQVAGPAVQAAKCRAVDLDAAGRRLQQAGGGIEQRRLAHAARPDAGAEFSRRYGPKNGRASRRDRVWYEVYVLGIAAAVKNKK